MSITKQNIFFDLDGTLLPMNEDEFLKAYLTSLSKYAYTNHGIDPKTLQETIWQGVKLMYQNDGNKTNEEVLWDNFHQRFNNFNIKEIATSFNHYYETDFKSTINACSANPYLLPWIDKLKEEGKKLYLLTNPLFPEVAVIERMAFVGLKEEMFEHITTYENSHYTKPNPKYYLEVINRFNLKTNDILMVGNNVDEDIIPTKNMGLDTILITDHIIGDISLSDKKMSFKELTSF